MRFNMGAIDLLVAMFAIGRMVYIAVDNNSKSLRVSWLAEAQAAGGKVTVAAFLLEHTAGGK